MIQLSRLRLLTFILQVVHPHGDQFSVLLVQLFGVEPVYKPRPDHSAPGEVKNKRGEALSLGEDTVLGWTAIPMFDQ